MPIKGDVYWNGVGGVGGIMGGMMMMKGVVRVSSMVWVGERQLGGRTGEVVLMKAARWRSDV